MNRRRYVLSSAQDAVWRRRHAIGAGVLAAVMLIGWWSASAPVFWLLAQLWTAAILATWLTRSVTMSSLAAMFVYGATGGAAVSATLALAIVTGNVDGVLARSMVVPLIEEIAKALPLIVIVSFRRSR